VNAIEVGSNTNIQDNAVVHVSKHSIDGSARPTVIGSNVTIGEGLTERQQGRPRRQPRSQLLTKARRPLRMQAMGPPYMHARSRTTALLAWEQLCLMAPRWVFSAVHNERRQVG
jgi:hypothetical protein